MPITRGNPPGLKHMRATVYNHFVRVDQPKSMIFVSGQLARDEDGCMVGGNSMLEQSRQVLRNIEASLKAAGATMDDVVWTTVFTTDMREFREIVAAREEFWRNQLPTSTMIEISHLTEPAAKIEVQVIAAIG
ncbi:MAG: RidA family protein [Pseudomonadota bacterium]|jgi:2-iminobutanoate/2-iminopropanoate deaminase